MNWDDDIDAFTHKKSAAKQGRRAGRTASPDTQDISLGSEQESLDGQAPMRVRKTGMWADEGSKSAKKSSTNLIEQERFKDSRTDCDSDDDIPIIPDIDDIQDEILPLHDTSTKAVVSVNSATYEELDSEFGNIQNKIGNVGNINLTFLTTHLYPEKAVKDVDEEWTMDDLFETMLNCTK